MKEHREIVRRNHQQVIDIFPTNYGSLRNPLTQFAYSSASSAWVVHKPATEILAF